jgi:hypothetical protein
MLNRFCKLLPDVSEEEKTEIIDGMRTQLFFPFNALHDLKKDKIVVVMIH